MRSVLGVARVRKVASRALSRLTGVGDEASSRAPDGPVVSLLLAATDAQADFLTECLDELTRQSFRRLEVVVAGYGECKRVHRIARGRSLSEPRVVALTGADATPGAAFDRAAGSARGEFLGFVRPGDTVPQHAVRRLVRSLRASGSDVAAGRLEGRTPAPGTVIPSERVSGGSSAQVPSVLEDADVEGKLFRRTFWTAHSLRLPASGLGGPATATAKAYVLSERFDLLPEVTYRRTSQGRGVAYGSRADPYDDLDSWLADQHDMVDLLSERSAEARTAWARSVLAVSLVPFVIEVERASPAAWERLVSLTRELVGSGPDVLDTVPVEARVRAWLITQGRRSDLEEFVASRWHEHGQLRTEVTPSGVRALLDVPGRTEIPAGLLRLHPFETPLVARLARARWVAPLTLEMEVHAYLSCVTMTEPPSAEVVLVAPSGDRLRPAVECRSDPAVTVESGTRYQTYDSGVLRFRIEVADLVRAPGQVPASGSGPVVGPESDTEWSVEVTLVTSGERRTGPVTERDRTGSAGLPRRRLVEDRLVGLGDAAGAVVLEVLPVRARLDGLEGSGRTLTGRLTSALEVTELVATRQEERVVVPVGESGAVALTLPEPAPGSSGPWELRAVTGEDAPAVPGEGHRLRVAWGDGWESDWAGTGEAASVAWRRTPGGFVRVVEVVGQAELHDVTVSKDRLVVRGGWLGAPGPGARQLLLVGPVGELRADATPDQDSRFVATFVLRQNPWGLGSTPLPPGYFRLLTEAGRELYADTVIADRLPFSLAGQHHDLTVMKSVIGRARISLRAPRTEQERGPRAQQVLKEALLRSDRPLDPRLVYLQSYTGELATDSPRAIHEELRRRRPDLTLCWGVSDHAASVPHGGQPVLLHSVEWYDVLSRAGHIVTNVDLERWHTRRPGQRLLQTFHGYPCKAMGKALWRAKGFSPRRIEQELRRTSGDWDLILTPTPAMDRHYREQYDYTGAIHSHGYPRDDELLVGPTEATREETRARLGIANNQTAILYAPTWRDDLARSYQSARAVAYLDVEAVADRLGEDHVLLLRGHRFTNGRAPAGEPPPAGCARLLDVTAYPEINHLMLACDAAVLDYSSVRFDLALLRRPMVFLVPDLPIYESRSRGFLYDFRSSAPGPLVDTSEEVATLLADLDGLSERHREEYERFLATYQADQDGRSAASVVDAFFGDPA